MANEIIQYKDDAGEMVRFTPQEIKERLCPTATDSELALCIELCNRQRLNPFTKEVYLVKYGSAPASIITSYQVFNRRACRNENYNGIKSGVVVMRGHDIVKKRGAAVYKQVGEQLIGGWAEVSFKDGRETAYAELALSDYSTGKSNWSKMPGVMIEKCAKAAAWRLAFPDDFSGMYTAEEMDQAQPRKAAAEAEAPKPVDLQPVRDLFRPFCRALDLGSNDAVDLICGQVGAESMQAMTEMQARRAVSYMEEEMAHTVAVEPAPEPEPVTVEPDEYVAMEYGDIEGEF